MPKKRIALITTWFPPNNGVAVNRMNAFVNYLSNDFDITVFTEGKSEEIKKNDWGEVYYSTIPSFFSKIKHTSTDLKWLHHIKTIFNILIHHLRISSYKKWKFKTIEKFLKVHQDKPFDLVLSSFSPIEPHEVALAVKKKFPNLVWIADMRDGMSNNPYNTEKARQLLAEKEQEMKTYVDGITTVSQPILDDFIRVFTQTKSFEEIRNGYDHSLSPNKKFNEIFTIVYAGTFYGKDKPDNFLKALLNLKENKSIAPNFLIRFVGANHNFWIPSELNENIEFIPKVPQMEAIEYMANADCNLLIRVPVPAKGMFSGKLFDYLSVEKPIIAMVDKEDVAAELIRENSAGFVVDCFDESEIEKAILAVFELWKNKEFLPIDSSKTIQLHRKFQVEKLSKMIFKLLEE